MARAAGFQTLPLHMFPFQAHHPGAWTGVCCTLSRADRYLGKAQDWGGGVISACGAQRHWWDQTLLKGIRGFGVGLLCPSLFLPFMLLTLSGKEDLAWHALSSSWQLPPGDSAGRASGASAVLGQLQPSWFLCRTELSFTVTFPTPHPLWCCLPPTPLSATPALQPQRLLSLLLG